MFEIEIPESLAKIIQRIPDVRGSLTIPNKNTITVGAGWVRSEWNPILQVSEELSSLGSILSNGNKVMQLLVSKIFSQKKRMLLCLVKSYIVGELVIEVDLEAVGTEISFSKQGSGTPRISEVSFSNFAEFCGLFPCLSYLGALCDTSLWFLKSILLTGQTHLITASKTTGESDGKYQPLPLEKLRSEKGFLMRLLRSGSIGPEILSTLILPWQESTQVLTGLDAARFYPLNHPEKSLYSHLNLKERESVKKRDYHKFTDPVDISVYGELVEFGVPLSLIALLNESVSIERIKESKLVPDSLLMLILAWYLNTLAESKRFSQLYHYLLSSSDFVLLLSLIHI